MTDMEAKGWSWYSKVVRRELKWLSSYTVVFTRQRRGFTGNYCHSDPSQCLRKWAKNLPKLFYFLPARVNKGNQSSVRWTNLFQAAQVLWGRGRVIPPTIWLWKPCSFHRIMLPWIPTENLPLTRGSRGKERTIREKEEHEMLMGNVPMLMSLSLPWSVIGLRVTFCKKGSGDSDDVIMLIISRFKEVKNAP